MTGIHIRTATNQDSAEIIQLVKTCLAEFNLVYSPESSDQDLQDIEATYTRKGGVFNVVENQGAEIIGTVALLRFDNKICKLRKMYVKQSYRGYGIGKLLMNQIIGKACQLGFKQIILETEHSMETAIGLYEKFGFSRTTGQVVSPRCDIVMKLDLSEYNNL